VESLIRYASDSRIAKYHRHPCRQQLDQELPRSTAKARRPIVGKRRNGRASAVITRVDGGVASVTRRNRSKSRTLLCSRQHRGPATRGDHPARWRFRPKAMRNRLLTSQQVTHSARSPQNDGCSAGGTNNGSNGRSRVKCSPGPAAARAMADHAHHRRVDGL
jgi:hypothetical protein